ncbi:hypothetical protein [Aestuariivirga sp.]|uniref:hypothetical protein n=1 Tax=Aestuariivirga sp. TaxID=2650926 RepID=UPI0025C6F490|nr:hypothetical protein [Aestuariivirga sp.]MCA3555624.1 hypothetical protein [Aestuariivirga sp.]
MKILVFAVSMLLCASAPAAELAGPDLRAALIGQTIQWWEDGGWHAGNLSLLPDGRAEITIESPRPQRDAGRWSISGNRLCTAWSSLRGRETKCYSLERAGPDRFVTSGGNVFVIISAGV